MATNQRHTNRGWQYAAFIAALLHLCLWIAVAFFFPRMENIGPFFFVDYPLSFALVVIGWNSHHLLIWFGILGPLWWYLLVRFAGILLRKALMLKFLPTRRRNFIWCTVGALWVLACVLLLVHTILLRSAPVLAFKDAEVVEYYSMSIISFPSSMLLISTNLSELFGATRLPETDPRSILSVWLPFFALGCLQWFVLVPWMVRRVCRKVGPVPTSSFGGGPQS
jgi:hypothetical protein